MVTCLLLRILWDGGRCCLGDRESRSSCVSFFFFQAEDGIRDLVRSRGLGDVYKRQILPVIASAGAVFFGKQYFESVVVHDLIDAGRVDAVSYTHMTLPTIYSV